MNKPFSWVLSLAVLVSFSARLSAQEPSTEVNVEEIVGGLDNPCGIAIQPETGMIFVSDSAAGKIIRVDPKTKKAEDVITGFSLDEYGKGPIYKIGPLGLWFQDKNTLLVGGGGQKDEEEQVFVYEVPEAGKTKKWEEAKQKLGPLPKNDMGLAEGNYYGVAFSKDGVFVSCNGDDTKGWVARAEFKDGKFGELKRFAATKEATSVDGPVPVAISPKGRVVVGQMGEINVPKDSLLTFYNPTNGKMLMNLKLNLFDPTALTYSTKTGLLYTTDFAWMDAKEGGLFRIDDDPNNSGKAVIITKIAALDKPTAAAFASDGALYVTVFGKEDNKKEGKLLKITGKKDPL
jgi:sugar lactone lactonase YvrE